MILKSLAEDEFLSNYTIAPADKDAFTNMANVADMWDRANIQPLPSHSGYAISHLTTKEPCGHDMAVLYQIAGGEYTPVGLYCGEVVAVHPDHQGKGLGAELILAAAPYRSIPEKRTVSEAGLATLKKAWKMAKFR